MYQCTSDPQHGWLRVKREELKELGIASQISSCSYENGNWVYLEIDCDVIKFLEAKTQSTDPHILRDWFQANVKDRHVERTVIRTYAPYSST